MLWLLLALGGVGDLPVLHLDHAKAVSVKPLNPNVIVCTTPNPLGFVRQIVADGDAGEVTSVLYETRCGKVGNTDPWSADFVETVEWARFISTGNIDRGTVEVVRLRRGSSFYYGAAEDFRVGI